MWAANPGCSRLSAGVFAARRLAHGSRSRLERRLQAGLPAPQRQALEFIRRFPQMHKRQFLDGDVASFCKLDGNGDFANETLVGKVLARGCDALNVEMPFKPRLDLGARSRLGGLAQVI